MKISDFANLQKYYTGANNKRKWIITNKSLLRSYLKQCKYKPAILKDKLKVSYSTVKRLLCSAELWHLVDVKKIKYHNTKPGRKRSSIIDKFGYRYAEAKYDFLNDRGDVVRRLEHHVNAEKAYIKENLELQKLCIMLI